MGGNFQEPLARLGELDLGETQNPVVDVADRGHQPIGGDMEE